MDNTQKAPVRVGARTGARMETAAFGEAAISYNYSTTQKSGCQISDFLSHGAQNGTPLKQLVSLLGIDGRTVREMITQERLGGSPILSDNVNGYFLPADEREVERFVHSMKHRSGEIARVAAAVERGLKNAKGD